MTATTIPSPVPGVSPEVDAAANPVEASGWHRPSVIDLLNDGRQLTDRWRAWLVTIGITLLAFGIRVVTFDFPKYLIFDETYYPKDAWTMLHLGYEAQWPDKISDPAVAAGNVMIYTQSSAGFNPGPEFVVHPPLGKWIIATGEWAFGMNSFGWRFPSLVFGCLLVAATIRLARRLSRSTIIGALAGILLTFDALSFVMSRIGLLDIFQAFFLVTAVGFIVRDRDWFRHKLADHLTRHDLTDLGGKFGPWLWWRPWRIAAGLTFGLACSVKWNSMFVLATMSLLSLAWDRSARRLAGAGRRSWWAILRDGIPAFVSLVLLAIPVYVASWTGWFLTTGGWDRQWAYSPTTDSSSIISRHQSWFIDHFGRPLTSWIWYHHEIYAFHVGDFMKQQTHTYNANPAGWLVMVRPIGIDAINDIKSGTEGCTAVNDTCLRVISGTGTPLLWWMGAIALLVAVVWWIAGRDWRMTAPLLALASTWIPWFKYDDRPVFFFYAICIIPFTVTILAMVLGRILGPADGSHRRRRAWIVGALVALIVLNFAFQYPILTDALMTRKHWLWRMWFSTWI